jgi:MoaA/NifB/PqqE/SkfB family radical SAM enzyme
MNLIANGDKMKRIVKIANRVITRRPVYTTFNVTCKCNSRCRSCSVWKKKNEDLTLKQIQKIFQEIYDFGIRFVAIEGGEPFLRSDIFEIMDMFERIGFIYSLTSNGILLSEEKIEELNKRKPNSLMISLDSLDREKYKFLRGVDGLEKIIRNIELLKEKLNKSTILRINTTVSRLNYKEVENILKFAEQNNAFFSATPCIIGSGFEFRGIEKDFIPLPEEKKNIENLFKQLASLKRKGHKIFGTSKFYEDAARFFAGKYNKRCDANRYILHIDADGSVSPCQDKKPFGDLKNENISNIWKAGLLKTEIENCYLNTPCYYLCTRLISSMLGAKGLLENIPYFIKSFKG